MDLGAKKDQIQDDKLTYGVAIEIGDTYDQVRKCP